MMIYVRERRMNLPPCVFLSLSLSLCFSLFFLFVLSSLRTNNVCFLREKTIRLARRLLPEYNCELRATPGPSRDP